MEQDRYGLPLGTASAAAGAAYREGIDLLLSGFPPSMGACCATSVALFAASLRACEAALLLERHAADFVCLGGSGAQRAVLEQTLDAARARLVN